MRSSKNGRGVRRILGLLAAIASLATAFAQGFTGFVQKQHAYVYSAISCSVTFDSANNAGNMIVVAVVEPSANSVINVADTRGNPYLKAAAGGGMEIWYAANIAAGANTVTVTESAPTGSFIQVTVHEYSGMGSSPSVDGSAFAAGADSGAIASTPNDLVFGLAFGNSSISAGAGFAGRDSWGYWYYQDTEDMSAATASSYHATASGAYDVAPSGTMGVAFKPSAAGSGSWSYRKRIAIPRAQVSANLAGFPMLYSVTDPDLMTVAYGGKVNNGADIQFRAADGVTQLSHEVEQYVATSGKLIAWVNVPAVSSSADTVLYLYFGNSSTASQQNRTAVWDANYAGVWHLPDGTTLTNPVADSTANGNSGTPVNVSATSGQIDGAGSLNGTSSVINLGNPASLGITGQVTMSAWVKVNAFPASVGTIIAKAYDGSSQQYNLELVNSGGTVVLRAGTFGPIDHMAVWPIVGWNVGEWHQVAGTFDGSYWRLYFDGVPVNSSADVTGPIASTGGVYVGATYMVTQLDRYLNGSIDEVRVSRNARNAAWIAAEYANQRAGSAFSQTCGVESGSGGSSITVGTSVAGLAYVVDGCTFTSAQTFNWVAGSTHTVSVAGTTQAGTSGTQYVFTGWSDGGTGPTDTIYTPAGSASYTASFKTQYKLTTSAMPVGSGTVSPVSGSWFDADFTVTVTAAAGPGYGFSSFTPPLSGGQIVMDGPKSVQANFGMTGDFALTTPPAVSVLAGRSGLSSETVTAVNGFAGTVTFTWANQPLWPTGLTAAFSQNPVSPGSTVAITITASSGTPPGVYTLTFSAVAVSGGAVHAGSVQVTVTPALSVYCNPSPNPAQLGQTVTYTSYPSGGVPPYVAYVWQGSKFSTASTTTFQPIQAGVAYEEHVSVQDSFGATAGATCPVVFATNSPDFWLGALSPQTVVAGGSTPALLETITPQNGFSSPVSFTPTSVPAGMSVSFSPNPASGYTYLTIGTSPGVAAGPYVVQFSASSTSGPAVSHTGSVSVTVSATSSFSVYAAPASQTVAQGGTATYTVSVNGGFSGAVNFGVSGLPADATATFNPASLSGSGATALTIAVSAATAQGSFPISITASSASIARSTLVYLIVAPPSPANMLSPAPGTILTGASAAFSWEPGVGVSQYRLALGSTPGASDYTSVSTSSTTTAISIPITSQPVTLYVTLSSLISGRWQTRLYTYRAGVTSTVPNPVPVASSPQSVIRAADQSPDCYSSSNYYVYNNGQPKTWPYQIHDGRTGRLLDAGFIDSNSISAGQGVTATLSSVPSKCSPNDVSTFDITYTASSAAIPGPRTLTFNWNPDVTYTVTLTDALDVYDGSPTINDILQFPPDYPGGPFYITLYGTNFGPSAGSLSVCLSGSNPCSGTADLQVNMAAPYAIWTDSQVNAQLIPSPNASGTFDVQMTSRGAGGNGFVPAPQGQTSAQSNRKQVVVAPSPVLTVNVNGTKINAGDTVTLRTEDTSVNVLANVTNGIGTMSWLGLDAQYQDSRDTGPAFHENYPTGPPATVAVGTPFSVSASVGGTMKVSWAFTGGPTQSFTFSVKGGANPTHSAIISYLGDDPWFLKLLPGQEGVWQQFDGSGKPVFGPPHGYGLMQIDPSPTLDLLFSWKANLDAGKAKLQSKFSDSDAFWQSQLTQWLRYNNLHPDAPIPAQADDPEANCTFTMQDPLPSDKYSFRDAIWIKQYNGATANYISWIDTASPPRWQLNQLNKDGKNYVLAVCGIQP